MSVTELVLVEYGIFLHNLPLNFTQRQKREWERRHAHLLFYHPVIMFLFLHVFDCNHGAELHDCDWSERGRDGLTAWELDGITDECLSPPIPNPKLSFFFFFSWASSQCPKNSMLGDCKIHDTMFLKVQCNCFLRVWWEGLCSTGAKGWLAKFSVTANTEETASFTLKVSKVFKIVFKIVSKI